MRKSVKIIVAIIAIVSCSKYEAPLCVLESKSKIVVNDMPDYQVTIKDVYSIIKRDFLNSKSSSAKDDIRFCSSRIIRMTKI